ncbi:unnamed protein product [Paramecium pentaurelia]|uniref:Uncharacterized protein n=1 Tax=Paramecium pentaurelia TaxID=43138 RepID=A0A8S1SLB4_9CILI|nr:unnamed protein product [Paramecium pentaurelia]
MNCTYHFKSPISMICIAPHKCQRKLCVQCLYDHGVDIIKTVPIEKFQKMAMQKLKDTKLDEISKLTQQRMAFKVLLSQTEQMLKKILEELSQSIKSVYDWIEKENQSFINIINKNINLVESSYIDIEKLVNIEEGSTLNDWNAEKNSYMIEQDKKKNWWGQHIQAFIEKSKNGIEQIQSLYNDEEEYQM